MRFVRCELHDPTSPLLTMLLGQHMPLFVPALKLPGDSCEARFPLEKETTSGRGWQRHM